MLIRNAAWSFGAQIMRLATALLLIVLLEPAARGFQSLIVLVPTLLASLTLLGVSHATPVLLNRGVSEQRLLSNLLGLGLCVVAAVIVVALPGLPLAARFLSGEYRVTTDDVLLGLLLLPPTLLGDYLRSLLAARRDLRQVALTQSVQAVAQLVLAIVLVLWLRWGARGAVWSVVLGGWCGFGWTVWSVRRLGRLRPRLDGAVLRPLLGLGLRGHVGNVVQTFNYRLDVLIVQGFLGQAAVGLYQTGVLLAEMIWYIPNAISAALLPQVAATGSSRDTPRVARHTLLLTSLGAVGLLGVTWPGLALLRPLYLPAVAPMAVLLLGVVALSIHKVLASDLSGRGWPHYPSLTSSLALVVTLLADLLLIPRFGILGAALASTLAYITQTIVLLRIYTRVARVPWHELLIPRRSDMQVYRRLVLRRGEVPR
ncbi:MAG TPA: polysaccharide biosynthesis C-terminal domain-containing protein [Herpetosiphonaceae bacterium]